MTAVRRLAAILAVDVAGYSRLMGENETGTARAVRERREAAAPIVGAFGGRVVKTTGDGALLEFPSVVAAVAWSHMSDDRATHLAAAEALAARRCRWPPRKRRDTRVWSRPDLADPWPARRGARADEIWSRKRTLTLRPPAAVPLPVGS